MSKYVHEEIVHNLKDPNIIVPKIIEILNPKSVIDIGCGLGTFLNAFKRHGVSEVLGIDGPWANKELLFKYISPNEFKEWNLEEEIKLDKKYDLVVSLEVAEHLSSESADIFIKNLVNAGNVVLFSAAIPNQEGQNHINEQWLTYWEKKFLKHNFIIYDVIRPLFWDNPEVFWWYKQNMVLVAPAGLQIDSKYKSVPMRNIVHYELLEQKARQLEEVIKGEQRPITYFKLFLKSISGHRKWRKLKLMLTNQKAE